MKLLLVSDTGESVEVRCDRCARWARLLGVAGKCGAPYGEKFAIEGGTRLTTMFDFGCALFERKETT